MGYEIRKLEVTLMIIYEKLLVEMGLGLEYTVSREVSIGGEASSVEVP